MHATKDGWVFDDDLSVYGTAVFYVTADLTTAGANMQPAMSADGSSIRWPRSPRGWDLLVRIAPPTRFTRRVRERGSIRSRPLHRHARRRVYQPCPQQKSRQVITSDTFSGLAKAAKGEENSFALNEEWYSLKNFAEDLHVILAQDTQGIEGKDYERPLFPSTWARRHGKGRVFYTSRGHREDVWNDPTF